jgi:uncharacterized protein YegL
MTTTQEVSSNLTQTTPNYTFPEHCILDNAILEFHSNTDKIPKELLCNMDLTSNTKTQTHDESFGCLEIHTGETTINIDPVFFLFTLDESGSMSDLCKDGKTKMDHIHFTMNQMLHYFAENQEATIYVHVNAFSDIVRTVIETTQVTHKNVNDIIEKIKKIRPLNSTNLELALKTANQTIRDHLQTQTENNQPSQRIVHVLLTDGHPTIGKRSESSLSSLVDDTFSNIFIAFGLDHNPTLMNKLGNAGKNTTNYLVTKLELIGHVYGEIVHNHLFKVLDNVMLDVVDGEGAIYDWYSNEWKTTLHISSLTSESKRFYYIKSANPDTTTIRISGNPIDSYAGINFEEYVDKLPDLITTKIIESESSDNTPNTPNTPNIQEIIKEVDLTKHIFRLCTQRLLYKARQYANVNACMNCFSIDDDNSQSLQPLLLQRSYAMRSHAFTNDDINENINNNFSFPPPPKLNRNITNADNINEILGSLTEPYTYISKLDSLKSQMKDHLKIMKDYLEQNTTKTNTTTHDKQFIKTLCDDMNIVLKTIGTSNQQSYINARSTSQGRQQMYNVDINDDEADLLDQSDTTNNDITNAYATPSALKIMRSFSER